MEPRGVYVLPGVREEVHEERKLDVVGLRTQTLLARAELHGWPGLRPWREDVERKEEGDQEVHPCECRSSTNASLSLHTSVTIPIPESTKWRRAIPSEEITIQMPVADSEQPARQNRQVGSSARRLRQVGSSARRFRQEPFDEPSARMKCHWRAFFELSELSAESLRQVAKRRRSPWNHP